MAVASPSPLVPDRPGPTLPRFRRTLGFLWWIPILIAVMAGGVTFLVASAAEDSFISTTLLLVAADATAEPQQFAQLPHERAVLRETIRALRIPVDEQALANAIDIELRGFIIEISVRATDPRGAQLLLQTLAAQVVFQSADLIGESSLEVVPPGATFSDDPSRNGEAWKSALAVGLGLIGGIGLALILGRREMHLRSADDFENASGWPALAVVPLDDRSSHVDGLAGPGYADLVEAIRAQPGAEARTILFTTPRSGSGTSTVAAHLAAGLTGEGVSVLLVDANLHTPAIHRLLNLPNDNGFADALRSEDGGFPSALLSSATVGPIGQPFLVMTSGVLPRAPERLFRADQLPGLLDALRQRADLVVLDAPAFPDHSETLLLASMTDSVIVALEYDAVLSDPLRRAVDMLEQAGASVSGLVVTKTAPTDVDAFKARHRHDPAPVPADDPPPDLSNEASPKRPGPCLSGAFATDEHGVHWATREPEELDVGAPAETNPAPGVFTKAPDPLADPIHRWLPQDSTPTPAEEPAPVEPPTADDSEEEQQTDGLPPPR